MKLTLIIQHRGQKRGDGIGYSGHKHEKGEKVIAMTDNNGYVLAPLPVAPVNETDMVLLPKGLQALKQVAKEVGLDLRGAYVNLDGGFDSRANRKCIFNAGMIPNIKENPATACAPSTGASGCSTPPSMPCGCVSSGPLRGKISSSGCCSDLDKTPCGRTWGTSVGLQGPARCAVEA
jgi:hypothetical protein